MKNKNGFTLIEVIVSVVLVSIVMTSLLASLIQLRKTYNVIHENSDIIVYTSSISRVINNDLSKNNGIKMITCSSNTKCEMKLGNDSNRTIEILENTEGNEEHKKVKTSLRYLDTSESREPKLIYIRTFELDRYKKDGVESAKGYAFLDLTTQTKEYNSSNMLGLIDVYTTLKIRVYNGIDEDISTNDIVLYTAGRYDFSNLIGHTYTIALDDNGADTIDEESRYIDEVFGVGFFENGKVQSISNQLRTVKVPRKQNSCFMGYYYKDAASEETMVIDSTGKIVTYNRFFKSDIGINIDENDSSPRVYAKWTNPTNGFESVNGVCRPKTCTVRLNHNGGTSRTNYNGYKVKYLSFVPDIEKPNLPYRPGYIFNGYYFSEASNKYHSETGVGLKKNEYYNNDAGVCPLELNAEWIPCSNSANVKSWMSMSETQTDLCKIKECDDNYMIENNKCVKIPPFLVYSFQPNYDFKTNEVLDTNQKINWDKDFEIHAAFKIPETGKRYLIAGSYDGSSDKELNIEVNTSNQLKVYIGAATAETTKLDIASGKIKANENVNIKLTWNSKEKKISLTSSGDGLVRSPDIKNKYVDISGSSSKTILSGGHDHRSIKPFSSIHITTLKYKTFPKNGSTVTLADPTSTNVAFEGWSLSSAGGNIKTSVVLSSDTTVYAQWRKETTTSGTKTCGKGNVHWKINGSYVTFKYDIILSYTFIRKANNDIYATTSVYGKVTTSYDVSEKTNWAGGTITIGDKSKTFHGIIDPTVGNWWGLNNEKVGNGQSVKITCKTEGYVEGIDEDGKIVNKNSWNFAGENSKAEEEWTINLK